jgi:hypothetical protein
MKSSQKTETEDPKGENPPKEKVEAKAREGKKQFSGIGKELKK